MSDWQQRTRLLLGERTVKKLNNAHVLLFGLGGVGGYTLEALVRAGIGEVTVVDDDVCSDTNRNRQILALCRTVGTDKTQAAYERVMQISPACRVHPVRRFYLPENADSFFPDGIHYDYCVDAIDTVSAKIDLVLQCEKRGIPLVSCMGTGNKTDASRLRIGDIYGTNTCPLCRVMRSELKKRGVRGLDVVWSDEIPVSVQVGTESGRHPPASVSYVPAVAGMLLAQCVILSLGSE